MRAQWVLERWRRQGFDTVMCYPSGYCCPANSSVSRGELPAGYCAHTIDSQEALAAVTASIEAGAAYRL